MKIIKMISMFFANLLVTTMSRCPFGWFGPRCDYMCRCAGGKCLTSGDCTDGIKCETGWFGPLCQYEYINLKNLISIPTIQNDLILDNNEETCVENVRVLSLTENFLFTWLRLILRSLEHTSSIKLNFSSGSTLMPCKQQRHFHVNDRTLDIYCTVDSPVQQVNVYFDVGVEVCSIYISGGRNVALKQETYQTSNLSNFGMVHHSGRAVDGNKNNMIKNGSCAHTDKDDPSPSWSVKFRSPVTVTSYILYNRDWQGSGYPSVRLKGFILESFSGNNSTASRYQDRGNDAQYIYRVVPNMESREVTMVTIRATNEEIGLNLELCEVDVFGETPCQGNKYGFDCNETCDCPVKCEISYNKSFGCPVCPKGYQGKMCEEKVKDSIIFNPWADLVSFIVIAGLSVVVLVLVIVTVTVCCGQRWSRGTSVEDKLNPQDVPLPMNQRKTNTMNEYDNSATENVGEYVGLYVNDKGNQHVYEAI